MFKDKRKKQRNNKSRASILNQVEQLANNYIKRNYYDRIALWYRYCEKYEDSILAQVEKRIYQIFDEQDIARYSNGNQNSQYDNYYDTNATVVPHKKNNTTQRWRVKPEQKKAAGKMANDKDKQSSHHSSYNTRKYIPPHKRDDWQSATTYSSANTGSTPAVVWGQSNSNKVTFTSGSGVIENDYIRNPLPPRMGQAAYHQHNNISTELARSKSKQITISPPSTHVNAISSSQYYKRINSPVSSTASNEYSNQPKSWVLLDQEPEAIQSDHPLSPHKAKEKRKKQHPMKNTLNRSIPDKSKTTNLILNQVGNKKSRKKNQYMPKYRKKIRPLTAEHLSGKNSFQNNSKIRTTPDNNTAHISSTGVMPPQYSYVNNTIATQSNNHNTVAALPIHSIPQTTALPYSGGLLTSFNQNYHHNLIFNDPFISPFQPLMPAVMPIQNTSWQSLVNSNQLPVINNPLLNTNMMASPSVNNLLYSSSSATLFNPVSVNQSNVAATRQNANATNQYNTQTLTPFN